MDPVGNVPFFATALARVPDRRRLGVLVRELVIALTVLLVFLLAGRFLLDLLHSEEPTHIELS
jgi:multiple antibiotic resistance protein